MKKFIISMLVSLFLIIPTVCLSATTTLTVTFDHVVPPDLKGYEIKCQPDDSKLTFIPKDDVETITDDGGATHYRWSGDVETTEGMFTCTMRAMDDANQRSEWSDPFNVNPVPEKPAIISITAPNVVVNITNGN